MSDSLEDPFGLALIGRRYPDYNRNAGHSIGTPINGGLGPTLPARV